jgi:DNA-binding Lrp family transcriptional regulator
MIAFKLLFIAALCLYYNQLLNLILGFFDAIRHGNSLTFMSELFHNLATDILNNPFNFLFWLFCMLYSIYMALFEYWDMSGYSLGKLMSDYFKFKPVKLPGRGMTTPNVDSSIDLPPKSINKLSLTVSRNASTDRIDKILEDSSYTRSGQNLEPENPSTETVDNNLELKLFKSKPIKWFKDDIMEGFKDNIFVNMMRISDAEQRRQNEIGRVETELFNRINSLERLGVSRTITRYVEFSDPSLHKLTDLSLDIRDVKNFLEYIQLKSVSLDTKTIDLYRENKCLPEINEGCSKLIQNLDTHITYLQGSLSATRLNTLLNKVLPIRDELVNLINRANDQNTSNETFKVLINNCKVNTETVGGKCLFHDDENYMNHVKPLFSEVDRIVLNNQDNMVFQHNTLFVSNLKTEKNILKECLKRIESETFYHENLVTNLNEYNTPRLELFKNVKTDFQELILAYENIISSKEANGYISINTSSPEVLELGRKSQKFRDTLDKYNSHKLGPIHWAK